MSGVGDQPAPFVDDIDIAALPIFKAVMTSQISFRLISATGNPAFLPAPSPMARIQRNREGCFRACRRGKGRARSGKIEPT